MCGNRRKKVPNYDSRSSAPDHHTGNAAAMVTTLPLASDASCGSVIARSSAPPSSIAGCTVRASVPELAESAPWK